MQLEVHVHPFYLWKRLFARSAAWQLLNKSQWTATKSRRISLLGASRLSREKTAISAAHFHADEQQTGGVNL
jgi:hypothetical protein